MDEAALSDASSDGIPRRDRLSFFLINQRRLINLLLWEAVIDLEKNRDFPLNGIIGETIESTSPFEHNIKLFATPTIPIPINPLFFKSSYRTHQERLPSIPRKEIALLFLNEKSSSTFLLNFIQKDIRAGSSLLFLSFSPRSKQAELSVTSSKGIHLTRNGLCVEALIAPYSRLNVYMLVSKSRARDRERREERKVSSLRGRDREAVRNIFPRASVLLQ